MYVENDTKKKDNLDLATPNNKQLPSILSGFILFMTISVGFGFLLGKFAFPTCDGCKIVYEEVRQEGTAYVDFVSGTEYISGSGALDTGQVIVRVTDYKGQPLSATCNATILNPDKSFYAYVQPMTTSTINGNYYVSFTIPSVTGIYEDYVNCSVLIGASTHKVSKSSSFHVSPLDTYFNNISQQIISVNGTCLSVNQTVLQAEQNLNGTINYVHQDILANLNATSNNITQLIIDLNNDLDTYYSNLNMTLGNLEITIIDGHDEILEAISRSVSDIEIIKEWLSYMFGLVTPTDPLEEGESWLDRIVGTDVNFPDIRIPRPNTDDTWFT
jgi:hypothetical protein